MKALILLQNLDAHIVGSNFLLLQWFLQVLQYQSYTESAYHKPRTSCVRKFGGFEEHWQGPTTTYLRQRDCNILRVSP